jgi:regulator of protease activity HflC (stomatin/prohibitin superfamily)
MEFDRLVVGFLVDEVVGGFFISVPPGHIACVYDRGRGVLPYTWGPGLHLKIPFWQIAKLFNAQILEYTINNEFDLKYKEALGDKAIRTVTKDGQHLEIEGSIHFRIDKNKAPQLWENVGEDFVSKIVRPVSRSKISNIFSLLSAADISSQRAQIENALKNELNTHFSQKGLLCEGVLLSEVRVVSSEQNHTHPIS